MYQNRKKEKLIYNAIIFGHLGTTKGLALITDLPVSDLFSYGSEHLIAEIMWGWKKHRRPPSSLLKMTHWILYLLETENGWLKNMLTRKLRSECKSFFPWDVPEQFPFNQAEHLKESETRNAQQFECAPTQISLNYSCLSSRVAVSPSKKKLSECFGCSNVKLCLIRSYFSGVALEIVT